MYKIGLSTCGKEINEELFQSFTEAGIELAEISVAKDKYADLDIHNVRKMADSGGVKLWSFHLPFLPFASIEISVPELCRSTVNYLGEMIKRVSAEGIDKFIIHPSGERIPDSDRPGRISCARESLSALADIAEQGGAVLAVEDLPRACLGRDSGDILSLIADDDRLGVCFDTNHLLKEDPVEFIEKVGSRIITLHVSDYDFVDERHWLPGEGSTDWQSICAALQRVGYSGPWLYEVGYKPKDTMPRSRDLTPADFVRNAREIFEGLPLTVIK